MKVIINKQTKKIEREEAFKDRFRQNVSFGPDLTNDDVSFLDPECTLAVISDQPVHNPVFQDCVLREPTEVNGKLTTSWAVINKSESEINDVFNVAIELFVDSKAQSLRYVNQDRMISFIGSADEQTDREARYMKEWRDKVWIVAKYEIDKIFKAIKENPLTVVPSPEFIIAKLPAFEVPQNH